MPRMRSPLRSVTCIRGRRWAVSARSLDDKSDQTTTQSQIFGIICLMRWLTLWTIVLISVFACVAARAQQAGATVGFTLDFQGANPSHYEIVISSDGNGSYSSNGQLDQHSEPADPAALKFTFSENIRSQMFDLVKKTHYLKGNVDSGH